MTCGDRQAATQRTAPTKEGEESSPPTTKGNYAPLGGGRNLLGVGNVW
jgi:hypothetical protein